MTEIKLTMLGTSAVVPTAKRNHVATLLTYKGENILVDCGEGTQRQFKKARISPTKITKILITHWHGDHVLGLPGLIQTMALMEYSKTLHIYGPKQSKKKFRKMMDAFVYAGEKFPIKVHEVSKKGKFCDEQDFYLQSAPMKHRPDVPCNAYAFAKKGKIKIDKKKLKKYKIPSSPKLSKLKKGKVKKIIHKSKTYTAKQLTYKEPETKVSFVFDTSKNKNILPLVKNSNVLICESTYSHDLKDMAEEYGHLTAKQAAQIAKKAKAKKLILSHVSQRYDKNSKPLLQEAKKTFKNTILAKDLDVIEVN